MRPDREIFIFPVQLTTSRIGNLITRLIHTLLYVMTIQHIYARKQHLSAVLSGLLYVQDLSGVVALFFTLLTDRASTIPSNIRGCQSGTWSQRGTKVNGSHHGDNPLLRDPNRAKSYATLQAMAPTNIKTVHQTSLLHISRAQPRSTRVVLLVLSSSSLVVVVVVVSHIQRIGCQPEKTTISCPLPPKPAGFGE